MINLDSISHSKTWKDLETHFAKWFDQWNPVQCSFPVSEFFGPGIGYEGSKRLLLERGVLKDQLNGIYVFSSQRKPFYVGISRDIVNRVGQHVKGYDHQSASLAYRIGADLHHATTGITYSGDRKDLDRNLYLKPAQNELMKCDVALLTVVDPLELYLFEVYVSMRLGTLYYNRFETH